MQKLVQRKKFSHKVLVEISKSITHTYIIDTKLSGKSTLLNYMWSCIVHSMKLTDQAEHLVFSSYKYAEKGANYWTNIFQNDPWHISLFCKVYRKTLLSVNGISPFYCFIRQSNYTSLNNLNIIFFHLFPTLATSETEHVQDFVYDGL